MGRPLDRRGTKPLAVFALYGALLALGYALKLTGPRWDIPGNVRNALTGLTALGMMAQGAVMARLIGDQREYPSGGFRMDIGFFRHLSDRPPIGQAPDRRGEKA